MNKTLIINIAFVVLILGTLISIARASAESSPVLPEAQSGVLIVEDSNDYDFGAISMAAGEVTRAFKIKNTGTEAVTVNRIYTSCMCTRATLVQGDSRFGPFGMPGHGAITGIYRAVAPDEEVAVEVTFDPAAHGPAGVGLIERLVTIENAAGRPIELHFSATVTP